MKKSPYIRLDRSDLLLFVILCVGVILRIWKLESHMIFFGDAGRDMLAAVKMIETKEIPLLGIPSSIPRFKQGPVFIWLSGLIFLVSGPNPLMVGYLFALLNCLALVLCYLLVRKQVGTTAATLSTLLLATSPLAVAHSRMPYHITPITFFLLIYFFSLHHLASKKTHALFLSSLAWAVLFQFELALFPFILLIPYVLWKSKQHQPPSKKLLFEPLAGLLLGLSPQILYDLKHSFEQLGGFGVWLIYRVVAFLGYKKDHTFSLERLLKSLELFLHYFSRIFSYDYTVIGVSAFLLSIAIVCFFLLRFKQQNLFLQLLSISYVLFLAAFVVHGSPSEAYFPPIIFLSVVMIGCGISQLPKKVWPVFLFALLALSVFNTFNIFSHNFFTGKNAAGFTYGPTWTEKTTLIHWMISKQGGQPFRLSSTDPDAHFASYLDDYRMIKYSITKQHDDESQANTIYFINKKNSELLTLPGASVTFFPSFDIIVTTVYETKTE